MDACFKYGECDDLSKLLSEILEEFSGTRRLQLTVDPEYKNLAGFSGNSMEFEETIPVKTYEAKKQIRKGIIVKKVPLDTNGKKFLLLNGKKFQILKPDNSLLQTALKSKLYKSGETKCSKSPETRSNNQGEMSKEVKIDLTLSSNCKCNKWVKGEPSISKSPSGNTIIYPPCKHIQSDSKTDIGSSISKNIQKIIDNQKVDEATAKLKKSIANMIQLKSEGKTKAPPTAINLMNNANNSSTTRVIPQKPELKPNMSKKTDSDKSQIKVMTNLLFVNPEIMEPNGSSSSCKCKKVENNIATTSTNTEKVISIDRGMQTDSPFDAVLDSFLNDCLNEPDSDNLIIGNNVNMGTGPKPLDLKLEKAKLQFHKDLQDCLLWDAGNLPIHKGVIQKNLAIVKRQCVILKARCADINIVNSSNYTPLQLAILHNVSLDIVNILLQNKADISVLDPEGNNVLHLAVENNRNDLLVLFLDNIMGTKLKIDHFNYDGLTPLMRCAFYSDTIDMAENLLKKGAQPNLRDLKSGRTAIFHAAENHNIPMVSLLLDYSADTKVRNFFGTSVHDAMFELDDMPQEIKYPILGRDVKMQQKRKLNQKDGKQDRMKRTKLEIVPTFQKIASNSKFVVNVGSHQNCE